jgi:hypothetical protein
VSALNAIFTNDSVVPYEIALKMDRLCQWCAAWFLKSKRRKDIIESTRPIDVTLHMPKQYARP